MATALKGEWIEAWQAGLAASGLAMPIGEKDIRFPYYADTLFDLAHGKSKAEAAAVVVKGLTSADPEERKFVLEVLLEVQRKHGISDIDIIDSAGRNSADKSILNWEWVQDLLELVDRRIPFASGASIALATNDVYRYLTDGEICKTIDGGVRAALAPDVPTVVVSHSLGTVVAYNLLRREGVDRHWRVPLFVTLGSPLGVDAMRKKLAPLRHPACVQRWFNAYDRRDLVALFPLDAENFPVDPAIANKGDVKNLTSNHHGISGYLSDPEVARTIYAAMGS